MAPRTVGWDKDDEFNKGRPNPPEIGESQRLSVYRLEVCRSAKTRIFGRKRPQRFWWRLVRPQNGNILAMSSEMYTNSGDCEAMARKIFGSNRRVIFYPYSAGDPETLP